LRSTIAAARVASAAPTRAAEHSPYRADVRGLDEMLVESRFERAEPILGLAVSGQRDEEHAAELGILSQTTSDLVAVHPWKPDVEEDDLGPERARLRERRRAIVRHANLVVAEPQEKKPQKPGGGEVVVDHEDPPRDVERGDHTSRGSIARSARLRAWKPHRELRPLPRASASHGHRASVEVDEAADERQA